MCGITGRFAPRGGLGDDARQVVAAMTGALAHRGPDGEGIAELAPFAVLGHRRLAVIDLEGGSQPMSSEDGRFTVTFNGEIYRFAELRDSLTRRGHRFRTRSDTEVILAAYAEWGEACVSRLDGMYAFALVDRHARRLFLARDPVGKKPLYWRRHGEAIDFASEVGALRHAADWSGDVDPQALAFYLRLHYVPSPWTIFRGVEKLRPGEAIVIDAEGVRRARHWLPGPGRRPALGDFAESVDAVERTLGEAVAERLVSDVPLGAFLSGGIDSGLVVAAMADRLGPGVRTTTIGFAGESAGGELPAARSVATRLRTDHVEVLVASEAADVFDRVVARLGEPLADSSAIPQWQVAREARRRVPVALSGDGGDEPFAGYSFRHGPHRRDARWRALVGPGRPLAFLGRALPRAGRLASLARNLSVGEDEAFYLDLCFTPPALAGELVPDLASEEECVAGHVRGIYRSSGGRGPLESILLADARLYLPENVLVKVDRTSMAHGLEVRSPWLSTRVLDLAFSISPALKMRGGAAKAIPREIARRRLPPAIASLAKRGFHAPVDRWLRTSFASRFEESVLGSSALASVGVDDRAVRRLWEDHRRGSARDASTLWALLVLDAFARGGRSRIAD